MDIAWITVVSVLISGDSLVTEKIVELSDGADVVLHDAMALQLVQGMEAMSRNRQYTNCNRAPRSSGLSRNLRGSSSPGK